MKKRKERRLGESLQWLLNTALVAMMLTATASGQDTRGTISGRVLDASSSPIVDAKVVITNVQTNVSRSLITNSAGSYRGELLLAGKYNIAAEARGFKKFVREGIALPSGFDMQLDLPLEIGALTESVTVKSEAPLLEINSVSSGRVLESRDVNDLPISGANVSFLAKISPGVASSQPQNNAGASSFNAVGMSSSYSSGGGVGYNVGGGPGGNQWSFDGTPNTSNNAQLGYIPSTDVVAEMRVETSNFDASIGHTLGIYVAMTSKTGTNQLHGELRDLHWQQRWQAMSFFQKQSYYRSINAAEAAGNHAQAETLRNSNYFPGTHENNFGWNLAGPVYIPKVVNGKSKLFFFFAQNGNRFTNTSLTLNTVPTLENRKGDFSQLLKTPNAATYQLYDPLTVRADPSRPGHYLRDPFVGNIIPQSCWINPMLKFYDAQMPAPNSPSASNQDQVNNYTWLNVSAQKYMAYTNREDFNLSSRHRFFGRWSWNRWLPEQRDWTTGEIGRTQDTRTNRSAGADWVWTINSSTVLDIAGAVNNFIYYFPLPNALQYSAVDVGLPTYIDARAGDNHSTPAMSWSGYGSLSGAVDRNRNYNTFVGKADLSMVRGRHLIKVGFEARNQIFSGGGPGNVGGNFSFDNSYTRKNDDTSVAPAGSIGHSWAAFMLGLPSGMSAENNSDQVWSDPWFGWYLSDTWRVRPKLTLSLGFRLEYELGMAERFNRSVTNFDPTGKLPINDAVLAAYAKSPIAERPVSSFSVLGGSLYAGVNGASSRLTSNELMPMPRFGVAYQWNAKTVINAGYSLAFDSLSPINFGGPDTTGFSKTTSTIPTSDFGQTWTTGNPAAGVSPLTNPFPVRADGTRFDPVVGSSLGLLAKTGGGWTAWPQDYKRARVNRWRTGIQREIMSGTIVEAAYTGTWADRQTMSVKLDPLPASYWSTGLVRDSLGNLSSLNANVTNPFYIGNFTGLQTSNSVLYNFLASNGTYSSPTIARNRLIRDYPQFSSISVNRPIGVTKFHSLELTMRRRFTKGLSTTVSYARNYQYDKDIFLNEFDTEPSWRPSDRTRPHKLSGTGVYELPFGKGRHFLNNEVAGKIAGGFQLALTYEYQPGGLLSFSNLFYYGDSSTINTGQRTFDQWFNTTGVGCSAAVSASAGFEECATRTPGAYNARVFPTRISGLRADSINLWHGNIARELSIKEKARMQLRVEMLDLFNRSLFNGPDTNPTSSNFGKVTSNYATNRWVQAQVKISF